VSGHLPPPEFVDALFGDENGFDVIAVESIARGYSRIKQLMPDLVIVFLEIDDVGACQLLSMLQVDAATSRIPVVTLLARQNEGQTVDTVAEVKQRSSRQGVVVEMN